jgi:hypothetical protein
MKNPLPTAIIAIFVSFSIFWTSSLLCAARGKESLDSFKADAERALGIPVRIVETDQTGTAMGQTFCETQEVLIQIQPGLETELHKQVLAHELGHAILCATGIRTYLKPTQRGSALSATILPLIAEIGSCYIDPLADAEAKRRGFSPDVAVSELVRRTKKHTPEEVHTFVATFGDRAIDFSGVALYCTELRPHSFPMRDLSETFSVEPRINEKFQNLKKVLGMPGCSDATSCFLLTKHLRDTLSLQDLILIKNPQSGSYQ